MRVHPDERIGLYRRADVRAVRRFFEAEPAEFEDCLALYRAWCEPGLADDERWARRGRLVDRCRTIGADWADFACALRCAARRRDLGLSCPPWWEGD